MLGPLAVEPREISARTLEYYERVAVQFREGTWDHDVRQNIDSLLRHIQEPAPCTILDLGCGPGRDLVAFSALGHVAIGVEGSAALARTARVASGCEVLRQEFPAPDLPARGFDGIFANASLFHVPSCELPGVLEKLRTALRPRGVLFASNPLGSGEEGWWQERYGCYHDLPGWRGFLTAAGFDELEHYYRPPGLPRAQQPWLATVWRRSN
jgi:SAM-dependent methyltransferase